MDEKFLLIFVLTVFLKDMFYFCSVAVFMGEFSNLF